VADLSNQKPLGGWLGPLIPDAWFGDAPQLTILLGIFDTLYDLMLATLEGARAAKLIGTATGVDLDALGALVALLRTGNETDAAYRLRIPAVIAHGTGASTAPQLQSMIQQGFGVLASIDDNATVPGAFFVTLFSAVSNPTAVMPMVRQYKAAGMQPTGRILILTAQNVGRIGSFRMGTAVEGGSAIYVSLPG